MTLSHAEQPLRLAITLWPRHSEVVNGLLVQSTAFLVADDQHSPAAEPAETAYDGGIVSPQTVTLQLLETIYQVADVVASARSLLVPCDLNRCPCVVTTRLMLEALQRRLQAFDLL